MALGNSISISIRRYWREIFSAVLAPTFPWVVTLLWSSASVFSLVMLFLALAGTLVSLSLLFSAYGQNKEAHLALQLFCQANMGINYSQRQAIEDLRWMLRGFPDYFSPQLAVARYLRELSNPAISANRVGAIADEVYAVLRTNH